MGTRVLFGQVEVTGGDTPFERRLPGRSAGKGKDKEKSTEREKGAYVFLDVVRNKEQRETLAGFACSQCDEVTPLSHRPHFLCVP